MTAVPRAVISIQSPWRQTPGTSRSSSRGSGGRPGRPRTDRHRGHRLGDDELSDLPIERVARPRPMPRPWRPGPRLHLAAVDRQQRRRRRRRRCTGRSRRWSRRATCRRRAARRSSRTPRARAASLSSRPRRAAEVAPGAGLDAGLHAGGDVGGARPEHGDPGPLGEVPERAHVGVAGVAVVQHDRGHGEQPATRKFHIIQPVVVNQKKRSSAWASTCRCSFFSCSSRMPPWPWTIAFGRPVVPEE